MDYQRCVKCGDLFPFTNEYFFKQKGAKGGLRKKCATCVKEETKEYLRNNKDKCNVGREKKTIVFDSGLIRSRRKILGISQEDMSIKTGIKLSTYVCIERNLIKKTSKENYRKICEVLEIKE